MQTRYYWRFIRFLLETLYVAIEKTWNQNKLSNHTWNLLNSLGYDSQARKTPARLWNRTKLRPDSNRTQAIDFPRRVISPVCLFLDVWSHLYLYGSRSSPGFNSRSRELTAVSKPSSDDGEIQLYLKSEGKLVVVSCSLVIPFSLRFPIACMIVLLVSTPFQRGFGIL